MSGVRSIATVASIDHAELIASGLEQIAADIRAGKLPVKPRRAHICLSGPDGKNHDGVASLYFGADSSLAEVLGMLELAKIEAIDGA